MLTHEFILIVMNHLLLYSAPFLIVYILNVDFSFTRVSHSQVRHVDLNLVIQFPVVPRNIEKSHWRNHKED